MVANGHVVTIASYDPPELLSYDVDTHATSKIADPYGHPRDVAVGKDGTLYALGATDVAIFPAHASARDVSCRYILESEAIAVDNEGDIFVNGYGLHATRPAWSNIRPARRNASSCHSKRKKATGLALESIRRPTTSSSKMESAARAATKAG